MRSSANYFLPSQSSDLEESPVFNVVIVYEDFETGKNARRTYDFLAEQLGKDCRFATQMWKFDVLAIPKLREMAAKDATAADIVIIAYHGGTALSQDVKVWLQMWSDPERHPLALVALYRYQPSDTIQAARNRDYLANLASRAGMEFFSQAESASGHPLPAASDSLRAPARALTPWSFAQDESAIPRWGINE